MTGMVVTCNKVQRIFYIKKIKIRKFKEFFEIEFQPMASDINQFLV